MAGFSPTLTLKLEDGLSISELRTNGRAIFIDESLTTSEYKPDLTPQDGLSVSDTISTTRQHWLSNIVPSLKVYVWNPNEVSPSGFRHIPSGTNAFMQDASFDGNINFGVQETSPGTSDTRVVTLRPTTESGVFGITNIRMWHNETGSHLYPQDITINLDTELAWTQGKVVASGDGIVLANSLPASQNIFRSDNSAYIDGSNTDGTYTANDLNTSHYCYMSVNTGSAIGPGVYNGIDAGIRLTYDYFIGGYHADASGVT